MTGDICLFHRSSCLADFEFFMIDRKVAGDQQLLSSNVNGFLGLGRSVPFTSGKLVDYNRGPSIVDALYDANLINTKMFSLHLTGPTSLTITDPTTNGLITSVNHYGSEIHFGDPLLSRKAADANDLRNIKLHDDLFWAATCRGFAFGSLDNDYRVPDLGTEFISKGDMKGVFDSVVNGIQMPPAIFDDYVEALFVSAGYDKAIDV